MNVHLNSHGKGTPLVLFHGWGFDSQVWQPLLPLLAQSYQIICVDLPGFGYTSSMDYEEFKQKLMPMLPQQFALMGWSLGGLFATRFALEESARVQALINVCSSPCFIEKNDWPGVDALVFENFKQNLTTDVNKTLSDFVLLQTKKKMELCMPAHMPTAESLNQGMSLLYSWDLRAQLAKLNMPVMYLFGRLDPITPKATMTTMQSLFPKFDYQLFNKAAHMPFLSYTEEFVQQIKRFIL